MAASANVGQSLLTPPGESFTGVAARRAVGIYRRPDAKRPARVLPNPIQDGKPLVFLVKRTLPGWLEVYLPVRPNQSTGWIKRAEAKLYLDPFRLQVGLRAHRLTVWRRDRIIGHFPIAVGRSETPTPGGVYYLAQLYRAPDPSGPFGPWAFGLSAFSNVLRSFGGGPGQVAIHGTNDPSSIGSDVSHGCIHLSNRVISRLAHQLPLGTKVHIVA